MNYSKLPADPSSLVLGIVALVLGFAGCCCYGIFAIIPLIIAIIGLMSANRSLKEFGNNPDVYTPQTRSNVSTARVLNIIAIVFNGIIVLMFIGALIFYGTMCLQVFLMNLKTLTTSRQRKFTNMNRILFLVIPNTTNLKLL